jgi:DNA-binding transcriptional MocR family regulator
MWKPRRPTAPRGQYLEIANFLAEDIAKGSLRPGDRLPTHRELARSTGVSVVTASKAYAEARRRGLVVTEVGRGTFVAADDPQAPRRVSSGEEYSATLDLGFNAPVAGTVHFEALGAALHELTRTASRMMLWQYDRSWLGTSRHRAGAAAWLGDLGLDCDPSNVAIVSGAQHSTMVILLTTTSPGDIIVTEELADPLTKLTLSALRLDVRGLPADEAGLLPEPFETMCRAHKVKLALLMPDHHSPTMAMMSDERRQAIARIARQYNVLLAENAVYAPLVTERLPPLSSYAPELSYYFTSISKVLAPGLRIGFIATPPGCIDKLVLGVGATSWMTAPLLGEIATLWIEGGTAARLLAWQQEELKARNAIAHDVLHEYAFASLPSGMHIWLHLPQPWRVSNFAAQASSAGVPIKSSERFAVGRTAAPHAVRVSLGGSALSQEALRSGLETLRDVLKEPERTPTDSGFAFDSAAELWRR